MCNDRITTVHDLCIITSLIEHTHIKTKYVCHIDSTSHTTFIRADDHHMIGIDRQILYMLQQTFDKLVCRRNSFKTIQRDRILYTRIMCIEGDDIVNTHAGKLLQSQCTVK